MYILVAGSRPVWDNWSLVLVLCFVDGIFATCRFRHCCGLPSYHVHGMFYVALSWLVADFI